MHDHVRLLWRRCSKMWSTLEYRLCEITSKKVSIDMIKARTPLVWDYFEGVQRCDQRSTTTGVKLLWRRCPEMWSTLGHCSCEITSKKMSRDVIDYWSPLGHKCHRVVPPTGLSIRFHPSPVYKLCIESFGCLYRMTPVLII